MRFDHYQPRDIQDAMSFMAREGAQAQALAGGTDLIPRIKDRIVSLRYVVNIKELPELQGMERQKGGWRIGALTTIRTLETSPVMRQQYLPVATAIVNGVCEVTGIGITQLPVTAEKIFEALQDKASGK